MEYCVRHLSSLKNQCHPENFGHLQGWWTGKRWHRGSKSASKQLRFGAKMYLGEQSLSLGDKGSLRPLIHIWREKRAYYGFKLTKFIGKQSPYLSWLSDWVIASSLYQGRSVNGSLDCHSILRRRHNESLGKRKMISIDLDDFLTSRRLFLRAKGCFHKSVV